MKRRTAAMAAALVMVAAAVGIGQFRKPVYLHDQSSGLPLETGLDTSYVSRFLDDRAGLLSESAVRTVLNYNANWEERYNSVVALTTADVESTGTGDLEQAALDAGA